MESVLLQNTAQSLVKGFVGNNKKSLGQNFLVDDSVTRAIAQHAGFFNPTDILEIGPGAGSLTLELLKLNVRYHAIEKDDRCCDYLKSVFGSLNHVDIRQGDVLDSVLPACCFSSELRTLVVSNLPYNVATQIYFTLVDQHLPLIGMVLMFQKEVAERFIAAPGTKAYGILSIFGNYYHHIDELIEVSPDSFHPRPKVQSMVLSFRPKAPVLSAELESIFRSLVKHAFAMRRKTLLNSLSGYRGATREDIACIFEKAGLSTTLRAENLSLENYISLTYLFAEFNKEA